MSTEIKNHICIIANNFSSLEDRFLGSILKHFYEQGYKTSVLSWKSSANVAQLKKNEADIWFLGEEDAGLSFADFPSCVSKKLNALQAESPISLIHCVDTYPFSKLEKFTKAHSIPVVCDVRCLSFGGISASRAKYNMGAPLGLLLSYLAYIKFFITSYFKVDRHILKIIDGIFVQTTQQKYQLAKNYRVPLSKIYLTPYGVDLPNQQSNSFEQFDIKKKLGIPSEDKIILAELHDINAWTYGSVLFTFSQIASKTKKAHLVILQKTGFVDRVQQEILDTGLDSRVHIVQLPKDEQKQAVMASEAVFSLVHQYLLMDHLAMEAISYKKPLITSGHHPISSFFKHGQQALVIDPHDRKAILAVLQDIFITQKDLSKIGQAGYDTISSTFNIKNVLESTLDSYTQVIESFRKNR